MRQQTKNELRCPCSREPLLAVFGLDDKGKVYVHIKVYKNRRIFGEVVIHSGDVEIRCRECFRWYRLIIRNNQPSLVETEQPEAIEV